MSNFSRDAVPQWAEIHRQIFGDIIPRHAEWRNLEDIVKILNIIGSFDSSNHTFFASGGGLDLEGASPSQEDGCIELDFGIMNVCKPLKLTFESIDPNQEWNYFRLELQDLPLTGTYEESEHDDGFDEQLTEISPGNYLPSYVMDEGRYEDEPLPATARTIIRLRKGSLVIFKKASRYNMTGTPYDAYGREHHMEHDEAGFRTFVEKLAATYGITRRLDREEYATE